MVHRVPYTRGEKKGRSKGRRRKPKGNATRARTASHPAAGPLHRLPRLLRANQELMILEVSITPHLNRLVDGESNSGLFDAPPGRTVSRSRRSQGRFEGGVGRRGGEGRRGWSDPIVGGGEGRERSIEVSGGGRTDERVRGGEGNLTEGRGSNRLWGRS